MAEAPSFYRCVCGRDIPEANRALHEIRCGGAPRRRGSDRSSNARGPPAEVISVPAEGWSCRVCTLHQPDSALACSACGASRHVPSARQSEGSWSCPQCTYSNRVSDESGREQCQMCGFRPRGDERYSETLINDAEDELPVHVEILQPRRNVELPTNSWICGVCTLENVSSLHRCVACGNMRPPMSSPSAGASSSFPGNATMGLLLGALGGAAINHFAGKAFCLLESVLISYR